MSRLTLLLAFHNHQPDGNFDDVFRKGYDDCYRPLLDAIAEFPQVRVSLHHTGPLLEWLDANRPAYLTDLRGLAARGQVEVLGGGFYEPMLAVLPDRDALGQLEMMNRFCAERLGARPRGMWLAERVWEPALAERIAAAGLAYTLIDDTHFRYAGMSEQLYGWYVTEKAGRALAIFPIEKELRYAIPFMQVHETMQTLERLLARGEGRDVVVTYGDDGEKFGMWPGTKEWVWGKGWLKGFFSALSQAGDKIVTSTFADTLDKTAPTGRVYLPTASYEEMGEWALPAAAQERYLAQRHRLEHEGRFEDVRPFFRGGVWQNFMSKYPEANFMHKKMVYVSGKVERAAAAGKDLPEARRELYRGQCNCAYWHGLFGGLYLNYLRHAVYSHLIAAEWAADEASGALEALGPGARAEVLDVDADLRNEVVLQSRELWVGLKPDAGGAFFELDVRRKRFNLANVLGRHPEGYHGKLREAARAHERGHGGGDAPKSIHDLASVKESGLEELLHYDRNLRLGFVDHLLAPGTGLDDFARSTYDERGDFANGAYEVVATRSGSEAVAELRRRGSVRDEVGRQRALTIDKTVSLSGGRLLCRWRLTLAEDGAGKVDVRFAPELSLTLLAGDDGQRRYVVPGRSVDDTRMASRGVLENCPRLELVDEWTRFRVALEAGGPTPDFWRFPLETASQSESGFERTYQGSVLAPVWTIALAAGAPVELSLALDVSEL